MLRLAGSRRRIHIAIPLGFGDNNKGEMGAFYGLFETMLRLVSEGRVPLGSELIVFSDSAICVGFLLQGWAFKTWTAFGEATRALFRKLHAKLTVALYWIRGHKGIQGNEDADGEAGKGAAMAAEELSSAADTGKAISDYTQGQVSTSSSVVAPPSSYKDAASAKQDNGAAVWHDAAAAEITPDMNGFTTIDDGDKLPP